MIHAGRYTYGTQNISIEGNGGYSIRFGAFCSIASRCKVWLGGYHRTDWVTTFPFGHIHQNTFNNFDGQGHPIAKGDILVGNDVWIAADCTLMSGINIGDGAVIANNSHVISDVPAYSIYGGNPGKVIKYRFNEEIIKELIELKWWNFSDYKINLLTPFLCSKDIEKFIQQAKKIAKS